MNKPKVVILCGGRGTRLREETETKPKPLVEIGGYPILWHIMKIYSFYRYNKFILCLGYKGETIKEYFYHYDLFMNDCTLKLNKSREIVFHRQINLEDWSVTLVDTGLNTLKGARIKIIEKYIEDDLFLLTYGDGVANINIQEIIKFHKKHKKIGTITGVRPPSRFGDMVVKKSMVLSFTEKPQASGGLINGGFFVFNKKFFNYLSTDENCDFEMGALEKLAEDGQLMVYEHKGYWACMDTYRDVIHLNGLWENNNAFWKLWKK